VRIAQPLRCEHIAREAPFDERRGDDVGHAVVGGFAISRLPFLWFAADLFPGDAVGANRDRVDRSLIDPRRELQRRRNRRLCVKARRERLQVRFADVKTVGRPGERFGVEAVDDRSQAVDAVDRGGGPGEAFGCKQRGEDAVARGVAARAALPHRKLAAPRHLERHVRRDR